MSWLGLLIVGVVLLALSFAPMPPPLPVICRWAGIVLLVIAGIVLLLALFSGAGAPVVV